MTKLPRGIRLLRAVQRQFRIKGTSFSLNYVTDFLEGCCEEHNGDCGFLAMCRDLLSEMPHKAQWHDGWKGDHWQAQARGSVSHPETSDWMECHISLDRISRQVIY